MERDIRYLNLKPVIGPGQVTNIYGFTDDSLLFSTSHPKKDGKYIGGGPLYIQHRKYLPTMGPVLDWSIAGTRSVKQPWIGDYQTTPVVALTDAQMLSKGNSFLNGTTGYGATGWARARPGNPVAGVGQFIYELHDLPHIPLKMFRRLMNFRSLGHEYLNVVFGWKPFVSDLRKMYELCLTLDKRLMQLVRDNGRGIRRSRTIEDSTQVTPVIKELNAPLAYCQNGQPTWVTGYSRLTTVTTNRTKVWFVGKFRYYTPDIGSWEWTRRATKVLYGAHITPEVVWAVIPWSWLIDWFANVSDIMSNLSANAVDNLTAEYAYIMRTVETSTKYTYQTWWNAGASIQSGGFTLETETSTIEKSRAVASPFGFGVKFDGLSPYQLGIVAALGISRWA